jgi:hypothetical protein
MYLEMIGEEDKKMAEGWKADADGILIFVGSYLQLCALHILRVLDWFIFRSSGDVDLSINSVYSAKLAGRPHIPRRKYLSDSC